MRERITRRLAELEKRTETIEGHLREPGNRDWSERATEQENDEVLERLNEIELAEVDDLRAALARIDAGSYGSCARCGGRIDARRLEVMPVTSVCIDCAD